MPSLLQYKPITEYIFAFPFCKGIETNKGVIPCSYYYYNNIKVTLCNDPNFISIYYEIWGLPLEINPGYITVKHKNFCISNTRMYFKKFCEERYKLTPFKFQ